MITVAQWIVWGCGLAALAVLAQYYRVRAIALAEEVLNAHDWVDEIIEALQAPEGPESQERLDRLVDQQRPDGRAGLE